MNPFSLQGRTILVTGGTQGVGAGICRAIAAAGGDLVIHGLRDDEAAQTTIRQCRELGSDRVDLLCQDLLPEPPTDSVAEIAQEIWDSALQCNPAIDGLVANAGTYIDGPFLEMSEDIFYRTMQLNVASGMFLVQRCARHWIKHKTAASVVITGSINGLLSEPQHASYDTSKGAVAAMTRSLCVELAPQGIRVNSMAPGLVRTPMTAALDSDPQLAAWMQLHTPNRCVPPADVCGPTVVFLLSEAAAHVHGQTIYVDGGMSAWQQPDPPAA